LPSCALNRYDRLMPHVPDSPLETIGLGGDGDEVDAIVAVERRFDVALDYTAAASWQTAGDVFAALIEALPEHQRHSSDIWPIFAAILCEETGADAARVAPNTLLLGLPFNIVVARWLKRKLRHTG
jgi:hypothetical protein